MEWPVFLNMLRTRAFDPALPAPLSLWQLLAGLSRPHAASDPGSPSFFCKLWFNHRILQTVLKERVAKRPRGKLAISAILAFVLCVSFAGCPDVGRSEDSASSSISSSSLTAQSSDRAQEATGSSDDDEAAKAGAEEKVAEDAEARAQQEAEAEAARKAAEEQAAAEAEAARKAAAEAEAARAAESARQQQESAAATSPNAAVAYVAASGNGKKYHSSPNYSNMKGTRQLSVDEAQRLGHGPCKKCY
ncbi:hypothetical protein [Adlercreutzia sp. ZJ242]|uniref:hypothetical protein n=1 Tax=Adlercreutzia sp. ZJ242 TaxID=2709409 RepID=UPI0013EC2C43|nr:hypothetical protein [Adlercreutzia sp. ZJ242]